ncbi:hypothetical protein HDZ31DRAFT_84884 [Schizophyllum fasciatum]
MSPSATALDICGQAGGEESPVGPSPPRAAARGFEPDELRPLKVAQLRDVVKSQLDNVKTPLPESFKLSKARKPTLIQVLTNPVYGFTTHEPKLVFKRGIGVQKQTRKRQRKVNSADTTMPPSPGLPEHALPSGVRRPTFEYNNGANTAASQSTAVAARALVAEGGNALVAPLGGFSENTAFENFSFENLYAFEPPAAQVTLTLYVLDERRPVALPDMVKISVSVVRNLAGGAIADWNEILREVQKTASAIHGSNLKLSYSRSDKDGFKIALLQVHTSPIDGASVVEAELLVDEAFPVYRIHVEPLGPISPVPRRASTPELQAALETLRRHSSAHPGMRQMPQLRQRGKSRTLVEEDAAARDKEWLQDRVKKRDGYRVMSKKHDMKMPYARVAEQWAFAVSCIDELSKEQFPHSKKQVYSYHIWDVLARKGTWCLNAKEGHRLYQEYAEHPDVVAAVQDATQTGHNNFLALLKRVDSE